MFDTQLESECCIVFTVVLCNKVIDSASPCKVDFDFRPETLEIDEDMRMKSAIVRAKQ
jgi:hypothetical protein